jgi:DNA polymerase III epsilon subunit
MGSESPARRIVALDTETTGFSPDFHRIVEVGAIEVDPRTGAFGAQIHELLNPLQPIPWGATKVHGLRDRDVAAKPHFGEAAPALIDFIRGSTLAIHNSRFDVQMLDAELIRHGFAPLEAHGVTVVDTLGLARELLPFLPSHKLDHVCDALAVDRSRRQKHGALLDAQLVGLALPRLAREYDASLHGRACGNDGADAAAELAALADEERARSAAGSLNDLELSFCRIASVLSFVRHCRLELLARWETAIALEQWACAHFTTSLRTSSAISNAAAAKALIAPDVLAQYRKKPSVSRIVSAKTEFPLGARFAAAADALRTASLDAHGIARAAVTLEAVADRLASARERLRERLLEAAQSRELSEVVISEQVRTSIDYARALSDHAPDADLVPFRIASTPSRVFRSRNLLACAALFGPPIDRRTAA